MFIGNHEFTRNHLLSTAISSMKIMHGCHDNNSLDFLILRDDTIYRTVGR
jgi:hypothetical protein